MLDGTRPYQQIPFQYSLHYLEHPNAELKHFEFLADTGSITDPRPALIRQLTRELGSQGMILAYNKGFEAARLREMAAAFPEFEGVLLSIEARLFDLMTPFQQSWYYDPKMQGSYSIKEVLPALCPDHSYSGLEVKDGGTASLSFMQLYYENDQEKVKATRKALLDYCQMDTMAMVKILSKIKTISYGI